MATAPSVRGGASRRADPPDTDDAQAHAALKTRLKRFAQLRSVQRALAASIHQYDEQVDERAVALRGELIRVTNPPGHTNRSAASVREGLPAIDRELDWLSKSLLSLLEQVSIVQLRSTMPQLAEVHRHDVAALLDLLLEHRDALPRNLCTAEYLVTLLSTARDGSRRRIACDPVDVSPGVERLCAELERDAPADAAEIELEFFQAAALDVDREGSSAAIRQMRSRKLEVGVNCFVPGILRAVVTYNTRVSNRIQGNLDAIRCEDAEFDALLAKIDQAEASAEAQPEIDGEAAPVEAPANVEDDVSVMDSPGLGSIADALARRLCDIPPGSSPAEKIALGFELDGLDPRERGALLDRTEESDQRLVARAVIVGAINRDYAAYAQNLGAIGIAEQRVCKDWVVELDGIFTREIAARIESGDRYEDAARLSTVKSRHLFTVLAMLARAQRSKRGPRPATGLEYSATVDMLETSRAAAAEAETGRVQIHDAGEAVHGLPGTRGQPWLEKLKFAVAGAISALALVLFAQNWIEHQPKGIESLRPLQLEQISVYLTDAYRNENGRGGEFVGRIDDDWTKLPPAEKLRTAREMTGFLAEQGVSQALVYDEHLGLQIHYAGGTLRKPKAGSTR